MVISRIGRLGVDEECPAQHALHPSRNLRLLLQAWTAGTDDLIFQLIGQHKWMPAYAKIEKILFNCLGGYGLYYMGSKIGGKTGFLKIIKGS